MSEVFKMKERFDYQTMTDLATYVAKKMLPDSRIAIGYSEFYDCVNPSDPILLEDPTIVVISSDGEAVAERDLELLTDDIEGAAKEIVAGQEVSYSTEKYPVLCFGVESEEEYIGIIFISVLSADTNLDHAQQSELVEDVEQELNEILYDEDAEYGPEDDPYTAWYYGTLFGDVVFDTQE